MKLFRQPSAATLALISVLGLAACEDDDPNTPPASGNDAGGREEDAATAQDAGSPDSGPSEQNDAGTDSGSAKPVDRFLVGSLVFGADDETSSYVSLVDKLEGQKIDYAKSRELAGNADAWLFNDSIYVAVAEARTITRYTLDGDNLVEHEVLDFTDYGLTSFGFWLNTFVSPTKAYFVNGAAEYIVWNPKTMEIDKTIKLPELTAEKGFMVQPGYTDRSVVRRGKYLLHPFYYAKDDFFSFQPSSTIAVIDTEKDEVTETLDAACPGLDFATEDSAGNFYFSTWVFAPGGAAVLDAPTTCVIKVPAGAELKTEKAFDVTSLTDGREGGAFRILGDDRAVFSVLHDDYAKEQGKTAVADVTYGAYWRFWSYDLKTKKAEQVDAIDWNAGAAYAAEAGGKPYMLVPAGDYSETKVYELSETAEPKHVLTAGGWALRLFGIE